MNNQEQKKKLSPPGREKNHICNKCGWGYPNPHPSAKHRRAHKKICGKPLGFKPIDSGFSDDEQQQNPSDDERQTPLSKIDKEGQSSDGIGGRPTKSEDELFTDAVTEFSPVDSEKSVKITEDSSPLLKVDANSDGAPSPGTEGSYVGLSDSEKVVERAVEVDLDSSPLLKVDTSSDSVDKPDVGVVEDNAEDTKKKDKDDLDEVLAYDPEHVTRNLSGSFETEIKSLETDGNISPSREDGVAQSEQEKGGGYELKKSDLPLEVESVHQSEENSAQNSDVSNNGDSKVSANTQTEEEAGHILPVSEDIPLIGDSDNLIDDFKDHGAVKSNVPLTLDSAEIISPLGDSDKDRVDAVSSRNMNIQEDSVSSDHIEKDNFTLDTDVVGHGDGLTEDSYTKGEEEEAVHAISVANDLPVAREHIIEDFKDVRELNSEIPIVLSGSDDVKTLGDSDTSNTGNMIQTHPDSQKFPDENAKELVNKTKIENGNQILGPVGSVAMESEESVDGVNAEAPIVKEQKIPDEDSQEVVKENKIVNEGDVEILERISEDPILKEPSSEQSILSHTAVEDSQNKENEQVASSAGTTLGKDSPSKDHSGVDISADLSSQNSLDANWGSASVLSTQSDARASVDADNLRLSPQEPAKPEQTSFKNSGDPSDDHQVNQSDAFDPPSTMSVVERGGQLDQNDAFFKPEEAPQNSQQPKPKSLTEERKKTEEEVMAKVTNWSTEKHQSTPLKSLLGEADTESQQKSTVKSVLRDEAPVANQTMNRDVAKEWNSPAGNKKDGKKGKGKPSWIPFVCCSSVNVS